MLFIKTRENDVLKVPEILILNNKFKLILDLYK